MPRRTPIVLALAAVSAFIAGCAPAASGPSSSERTSPAADSSAPARGGFDLVPDGYRQPAAVPGTLEHLDYATTHAPGATSPTDKRALVYLPPAYDPDDESVAYDVFYLMHGGGGSEYSWMGRPDRPTALPAIFDHMIADGLIEPLIVVAPTYDTGYATGMEAFAGNVAAFTDELLQDLIPAIDARYRTWAASDAADARAHRAFGGFSMGGVTTWHMLEHALGTFEHFLPMSGDSWNQGPMGGLEHADATAAQLAEAAVASGYGTDDYDVFAATGSGDFAEPNMTAMLEAMRARTDAFVETDRDFIDGNLIYDTIDGHLHDYPWGYDYIYAGLPLFFPGS